MRPPSPSRSVDQTKIPAKALRKPNRLFSFWPSPWGWGSLALAVVFFMSAAVLARQGHEPPSPQSDEQISETSSSASPCLSHTAQALLPALPESEELLAQPLPPGVSSFGPPMTGITVDPDSYKDLYGYSGPYYNTSNLSDRVLVLAHTVYTAPTGSWKAAGLMRNQTCDPVTVTAVTARLLGARGELLHTAEATTYLDTIRPGEPAPFDIQAPVAAADVRAVDWHIEHTATVSEPRLLSTETFHDQVVSDNYFLDGQIHNTSRLTAMHSYVVAVWLDKLGRVRHVALPKLRLRVGPSLEIDTDEINIPSNQSAYFIYTTAGTSADPALTRLLGESRVMLWSLVK